MYGDAIVYHTYLKALAYALLCPGRAVCVDHLSGLLLSPMIEEQISIFFVVLLCVKNIFPSQAF